MPAVTPASAASPAYCALYAREYAAARIDTASGDQATGAIQRVEDQAYYRCLNMDEEPEFPTTSAYFGTEDTDSAIGGPFEVIEEGDASVGDETAALPDAPAVAVGAAAATSAPAAAAPDPKPVKVANASPVSRGSGSGLKPWSDEWVTWCKAHYRSFNLTTGMVLTLSGTRKMCP